MIKLTMPNQVRQILTGHRKNIGGFRARGAMISARRRDLHQEQVTGSLTLPFSHSQRQLEHVRARRGTGSLPHRPSTPFATDGGQRLGALDPAPTGETGPSRGCRRCGGSRRRRGRYSRGRCRPAGRACRSPRRDRAGLAGWGFRTFWVSCVVYLRHVR